MRTRDLTALKDTEITPLELRGAALCRRASAEGSVLLENNGVLPLTPCRIALFGFGARQTINTGIGSGDVCPRYMVNVEQGLENAGFSVRTKRWLDEFDRTYRLHREKLSRELKTESERTGIDCLHLYYTHPHEHIPCQQISLSDMADADAAVYVLSRKEGEGCDNSFAPGGYLPAQWELEQLSALRARYSRLILLLNIGSVLDMNGILAIGPDAVLLMYQGGSEIGNAVADMLTGSVPPSGRLAETWAKEYRDYPNCACFGRENHGQTVRYKESIYVGYRYFDSFGLTPAYPFGYGLSYTSFSHTVMCVTVDGGQVRLAAAVTNTGEKRGREVIQAYLSSPPGRLDKPYQQLCAFVKTSLLEPGEAEQVTLSFDIGENCSYDAALAAYVLERGDYVLRVGCSSRDTHICARLRLPEEVTVRKVRDLFDCQEAFPELQADPAHFIEYPSQAEELAAAPVLELNPGAIPVYGEAIYSGEAPNYLGGPIAPDAVCLTEGARVTVEAPKDVSLPSVIAGRHTMEQLVASMDTEELIHLTTGQVYEHPAYRLKCYSPHVLGACGESTNYFEETDSPKKIPYCVMADGGSGLRLIRRFQTDENGEIIYLDPLLNCESGEFGVPDYREGLEDYYQYATALPISAQLACAWNRELLEQIGDVVGEEMERFDVDIWLSSGINIQRNPLGGRNFEYCSEDPLATAMAASAIVRGVQSHAGRYATIKHAAANNQETDRTSHIAYVGERALREIYLRAFEFTIKYSDPGCIMTSLNCLNGPHNTNNRALTTGVIKDEWGYRGLVITDWNTTRKDRGADTALCISSGQNIIMPGSNRDLNNLRAALHNTSGDGPAVRLGELQKSALGYLRFLARSVEARNASGRPYISAAKDREENYRE